MESSGELLAPSGWAVYGKCAKTDIIVDWSAGSEMGAVSAVLARRASREMVFFIINVIFVW